MLTKMSPVLCNQSIKFSRLYRRTGMLTAINIVLMIPGEERGVRLEVLLESAERAVE